MAFVTYKHNEYDFSEDTDGVGIGDAQPEIENNEGRTVLPYEIVLQHGSGEPLYCGEVREYNGIADGAKGRINIEHRRVIRTTQIKKDTTTFAINDEVFFDPGGAGAAGVLALVGDAAAGSIAYGRVVGVGGASGAYTYLEVRPYAYDSERVVTT